MSWSDELDTATFRGVTFEVASIDDDLERRVAEHEYPYRNGAELDDLGRRARPTRVVAVFQGAEYLAELGGFMQLIDDGKSGLFQHPLLGSWQAKVTSCRVRHSHSARDMAEVELELREDQVGVELPDVFSIGAAQAQLASTVVAAQSALDTYGEDVDAQDAIDDAASFASGIESTLDDLSARMAQLRNRIETAVAKLQAAVDVKNYPVVRALRRCLHEARALKESAELAGPAIMSAPISATMPIVTLANTLYKNPAREIDLLRLNRVRNPFLVRAGTPLRVHTR